MKSRHGVYCTKKWLLFELCLQYPWEWCQTCSDLNTKLHFCWNANTILNNTPSGPPFGSSTKINPSYAESQPRNQGYQNTSSIPRNNHVSSIYTVPISHPEISPKFNLRNKKPSAFWVWWFTTIYFIIIFPINHLPSRFSTSPAPCSKCIPSLKLTANIAPENGRFEDEISFWDGLFSGSILVSGRVYLFLLLKPRRIVETLDGIRCPSTTRSAQEFQGH